MLHFIALISPDRCRGQRGWTPVCTGAPIQDQSDGTCKRTRLLGAEAGRRSGPVGAGAGERAAEAVQKSSRHGMSGHPQGYCIAAAQQLSREFGSGSEYQGEGPGPEDIHQTLRFGRHIRFGDDAFNQEKLSFAAIEASVADISDLFRIATREHLVHKLIIVSVAFTFFILREMTLILRER